MTTRIIPPVPRITLQLPTLGGTAAEPTPVEPFAPPMAWACITLAAALFIWAARRPREKSVARGPSRGRTEPFDEVLLAERA